MAATEKNGQASMEEILASIRRIIAEEPAGAVPLIDLNRKPNGRNGAEGGDDGSDFELPSMFRHRRPTLVEGRQPLYGRLTDALRQAAPVRPNEQTNGRGPGTASGHRTGQTLSQSQPQTEPQSPASSTQPTSAEAFGSRPNPQTVMAQNQTLSELTPRRDGANVASATTRPTAAEPRQTLNGHGLSSPKQAPGAPGMVNGATVHSQAVNGAAATAKADASPASLTPTSEDSQTPRVMAPFRDVRMAGMGSKCVTSPATAASASAPSSPAATHAASSTARPAETAAMPAADSTSNGVDFSSIVPLQMGLPGRQAEPAANAAPVQAAPGQAASGSGQDIGPKETTAAPPPLPDEAAPAANGRIEDATADLLRPMLRQWLAENMPRMVEKALHIEVAESVQLTNKPGQNKPT